ncbi:hypothetical protein KC19_4G117600 [Ceratodon purpureus]|uniref:Uncharacterized protein n=1 Tax=Ceratodon purpureus TaxID=3225 RepID=A0A8T0IB77_CERPU|nr:hypothetical protein KC19_4G117600 [Ceratodon purpureus]
MELLHSGSVETPLLVWNDIKRSELRKVQPLLKIHYAFQLPFSFPFALGRSLHNHTLKNQCDLVVNGIVKVCGSFDDVAMQASISDCCINKQLAFFHLSLW